MCGPLAVGRWKRVVAANAASWWIGLLSPAAVASTANVLVGGELVSNYKEFDETYDVWLRAERRSRQDADGIARLTVPSAKAPGGMTELGNVARFESARGPATIERMARQR